METNEQIVKDANLCNSINERGFIFANKGMILDRDVIINNYSQETIDACWESLSINVIQNYQRGKGTFIKGFGTFTFKAPEVNLEGTTNQFIRDKKPRKPVFIVSKEFNDKFVPGEFSNQNGIRYYTQKQSKDISIVKVNYSDIAYSLSMSKDEVTNLLKHLLIHLNNNIVNKTFKNKILPGLGILINRNNIIAVKFNDNFILNNKIKNQKLAFTKRNILLNMNMENAQNVMASQCLTPQKNIEELKASQALNTNCEKTAKEFLKNNYNIEVNLFPNHIYRKIYNDNKKNEKTNFFSFSNDDIKKNKNPMKKGTNNNNQSPLDILDDETLKTLEYYKGMIIKNCKNYDTSNTGTITKEEAINVLIKANINNKIDYNAAKFIVDGFNKTEKVDYKKFVAQLVKNSRIDLLKRNPKIINSMSQRLDYNAFKRENYFITNNKLKLSTTSYGSNFFQNNSNKRNNSVLKSLNHFNNISSDEEEKNSLTSKSTKQNEKTLLSKTKDNFFISRQKETEKCKIILPTLAELMPQIKRKYYTSLDQKISSEEFMNILKQYNILYPKEELIQLLVFLGINNFEAFSLREFESCIRICKVIDVSIGLPELNKIMKKLKDVVYLNGGSKFLFNNDTNPKNTIDSKTFVKLIKDKLDYSSEILTNVFIYLVRTDREFNMEDYINYFENPKEKKIFDETYFLNMMKAIIDLVNERHLKGDEYFDHLLLYNISALDKVITRLNWVKYLQNEKLNFSAEELDQLFNWIDTKQDGVLDREEFITKYNHTLKPLTIVKDIIHTNKLDIEDLAHHMKINISELKYYDFNSFREKIKKLNYTYPDTFIKKMFDELIKKNPDSSKNNLLSSKDFLDQINYIKPPENYKSFTQNYMNVVKSKISYDDLKALLEKFDKDCLGTLTKLEYVSAVSSFLPEFSDDDHMKFIRITDMFDKKGNIDYPEMLNLIFFYNKEKLSDPFTKLCQVLSNLLTNDCEGDVERLMYLIEIGIPKRTNSIAPHKPLSIEQVKNFMKNINILIPEHIIQKLDIDADGVISINDLFSVLKRFTYTSFFKYTNDSTNPNINLFSSETMSESMFIGIVKNLKEYMKRKNITEIGLFKKFDKDNDGFISCVDFNTVINEILSMSPALKDQFFNYLDFYHNGLVDIETFVSRIKDIMSTNVLVRNNNKIENEILEKMKEFVIRNNKLSDNEIFEVIDKDCDGLISIDDFKKFITKDLFISEIEFNKSKLERVMMSLSLSKNLQIGLSDIREFINLCNGSKDHMNLKEVFKITANQNLSDLKQNQEWTNDIIERLGMFVSEKYDSIEQFFEENSEPGSNKFKYNDFINFYEKNYELFNNGFNLTKDELLSIYTSLDSQKKNFLTLRDLKNKLSTFNFYTKMHIDVKSFIQENFYNSVDAFKFFLSSKYDLANKNPDNPEENDINKNYITLKEFFDAFENFFPHKYPTNTILKYLNKYFNITLSNNKSDLINKKDIINFSEFNYVYFDTFENDSYFTEKKFLDTKMMTNRQDIANKEKNDLTKKSENNFYYSNLFKKRFDKLVTPFDNDPLDKIKRILCSSKYDLNKFFETAAMKCDNDKFIVNKYQFRNIIKDLNIGLTNLEIDQIIFKCGKLTYDGNLDLKEFIRYLYNQNNTLEKGKQNVGIIMGEIKSLIYKFYSNPIVCFQNNDTDHTGKIDFNKFKNIIFDMYKRNEQKLPNFALIKNAFDTIDIRKDGIIDCVEWSKSFAGYNGKLDILKESVSNGLEFYDRNYKQINNFENNDNISHNRKVLREWETSRDVAIIYKYINKNRKIIKQRIAGCNYMLDADGIQLVSSSNLINILKDIIPGLKLSYTQWQMIVNVSQTQRTDGLIDINDFFRLMDITAKNLKSHPKIKKKLMTPNINDYSGFNTNGIGFKTMINGFYNNRRSNSIDKDQKSFNELNKIFRNPYSNFYQIKRGNSQYKSFKMQSIN